MPDFRPLLDYIELSKRAKTKHRVKWVRRIAQCDFGQLAPWGLIGANNTLEPQGSRSVAVGVNRLQCRLPNVPISGLRISVIYTFPLLLAGSNANWLLEKAPFIANFKMHPPIRSLNAECLSRKIQGRAETQQRYCH
jgi:hypothetical protein